MLRGKVKWFADDKGYGFIVPADGSAECFVHHTDIDMQGRRTLKEGELVEFDTLDSKKGRKAVRVKRLETAKV